VIRIHLTTADLARVRFAARPAPLQELNAALMTLMDPRQAPLLLGPWRGRALRALPAAALRLRDLVPGRHAPAFLDSVGTSLKAGFDALRASDPKWVAAELELAYAGTTAMPPPWLRELHRGARGAWQPVIHARRVAFDALLAPVWPQVQDLHRAEFARYAATVAQDGLGQALTTIIPGSRLNGGTWELPGTHASGPHDIHPRGRDLLLLPTLHWADGPLVSDLPDRPVTVTFPAGPGLPPPLTALTTTSTDTGLADVLGRTRLRILELTGDGLNTSGLARSLSLSAATISAHTTALRTAGLITTTRDGKALVHRRTALANLLLGTPHHPDP